MAPTVVIVDDHAGFRAQASDLLAAGGYQVLAACPDGRSGLGAIADLRPDLVLVDVQLPDLDGFAVIAQTSEQPHVPVFVLISTREAGDYGGRVARSGAAGFISKADLSAVSLAAVLAGPVSPVAQP